MKIDGTIIITDPCYFVKRDEDWSSNDTGFNYVTYKINPSLGFTDYIWEATKVGDGRWKVSEMNKVMCQLELEKFVEDIEDAYYSFFKNSNIDNQIKLEDLIRSRKTIGRFCVDSGSFGVFKLDEVLKYCPDFLSNYGDWCYTIIPNFIGDVNFFEDSNNQVHILGVGNKSFYSNTVSWL